MKRFICVLLILCLILSGCGAGDAEESKQYSATFLTVFDTVTVITGRAESKEAFSENAQAIHDELRRYHELFDIYNGYEVNNLKTVNDNAGIAPVVVDSAVIDLLQDCRHYHEILDGVVNPAMGGVLQLWHEARNDGINDPANAYLPDAEALKAAAEHMDMDALVIDEAASTVFITDPLVQLDVGAIAKGWAVQRVCEDAPKGLLVSVGGNVCATGPKDEAGTPWVVGIQNPDGGENYLHTLEVTDGSIVTSGDYQRAYVVDGELYHHIIDPATLYPSTLWRSVTIICGDSGLADALSTALFVLPQPEGEKLLPEGTEAMWVDRAGNRFYSPGFIEYIRN